MSIDLTVYFRLWSTIFTSHDLHFLSWCLSCLSSLWPRARMPPPCFVPPVDLVFPSVSDDTCCPARSVVLPHAPESSMEPFLLGWIGGGTSPAASVDDVVHSSSGRFRFVVLAVDVTLFVLRFGFVLSLFTRIFAPFCLLLLIVA